MAALQTTVSSSSSSWPTGPLAVPCHVVLKKKYLLPMQMCLMHAEGEGPKIQLTGMGHGIDGTVMPMDALDVN